MSASNPEGTNDDGFQKETTENTVTYGLFILGSSVNTNQLLRQLEGIRRAAIKLCSDLTKDYIWQREAFDLQLRTEGGERIYMVH